MNAQVRQGPVTGASIATFKDKYCQPGEGFREVCNRVAFALSDGPDHYHRVRGILLDTKFLVGGRIYSNAGTTKRTTPYNCFVSGPIADSLVDGPGSIMQRVWEAAATMRMGGGIGYDFSTLRPAMDYIAGLDSHSTGPCSFMQIFNSTGVCISSSGHRRGAQMGVLRVDHPDIEAFILAKQNTDMMAGFNLSVAVTNEFMEAVQNDTTFALRFNGKIYRQVNARNLWEAIMRSTWDWAEPGVIFIDNINAENNLYYCETIAATNPCAEQPLPPHGACLLGSWCLTSYLVPTGIVDANKPRWRLNLDALLADIPPILQALDNVVDRALYPLAEQRDEAFAKRRMGMGLTGVANALEACGHPYGSVTFVEELSRILEAIRNKAYASSVELARIKGTFPAFNREAYLSGRYISRLPGFIRDGIAKYGIRNSHLISIAPTGTISFCADNVSGGIEPVYAKSEKRIVRAAMDYQEFEVEDYGYKFLGVEPRSALDIGVHEHIAVITAAQPYVDSGVSKTCNVGSEVTWAEFKDIYMQAWKAGAKMCSTYRPDGKRSGVRTVSECNGEACSA